MVLLLNSWRGKSNLVQWFLKYLYKAGQPFRKNGSSKFGLVVFNAHGYLYLVLQSLSIDYTRENLSTVLEFSNIRSILM